MIKDKNKKPFNVLSKKGLMMFGLAGVMVASPFMLVGCGEVEQHTEHAFITQWTIDETHHWHKCDECKEIDGKAEHNWNDGVVLVPETGHAEGSKLVVCNSCGFSQTVSIPINNALVTADEWEDAIALDGVTDVKIDVNDASYVIDGIHAYNLLENTETFTTIENDKYISYNKIDGVWSKQEISEESYNKSRDLTKIMFAYSTLDFNEFQYNSITKAYEAENVEGFEGTAENKVEMFFENQKLKKIQTSLGTLKNTTTFDYSDQTLVIPTQMATYDEWQKAFEFGYENYQADVVVTKNSATTKTIINKNGMDKVVSDANGPIQYARIEDGKYYLYSNEQTKFTRIEILEDAYLKIGVTESFEQFTEQAMFEKFAFNAESGAYEVENIQSGETLIIKMQVFFENGKIGKIVANMNEGDVDFVSEANFAYNNEAIEFPTDYESLATPYATKAEMKTACDFLNIDKYQIKAIIDGVETGESGKKDGDKLYMGTPLTERYANIENGVYYGYNLDGVWTKSEITVSKYREFNAAYSIMNFMNIDDVIEALTYNSVTGAYEATNVTVNEVEANYVQFYFSNLKLIKWFANTDDGDLCVDVSYEDEQITLPNLEESLVTLEQWNKAIVFDGLTQYKLTAYNEGEMTDTIIVNNDKVYDTYSQDSTLDNYYTKEGESYFSYYYSNYESQWKKKSITEDDFNNSKNPINFNALANEEKFALFEHSVETGAYTAQNVTGLDLSYPVDSMSITFKDGKMIKVEMVYQGETMEVYIEYGAFDIVLPIE